MSKKRDYEDLIKRIDELESEILESRQAREALSDSEERYRTLFENSRDAIAVTTRSGRIIDVNEVALELFRYTKEEITGLNFRALYVNVEDAYRFQKVVEKSGSVKDYEVMLRKKDGTVMDCLFTVNVWHGRKGKILGYQGIIRDVSEKKRAEAALSESENRFRTVVEGAPFGISIMTPDKRFEYFNKKFQEIFGYTRDDLPDKENWFKKAYPDEEYRREVASVWRRDFNGGSKFAGAMERVYTVKCKNGQDKIIRFKNVPLKDGKQFLTYEDITASKEAEESLRQTKERYQTLVEESFDGIFVQKGLKIVFANRRLHEMLGYDEGELLGLDHWLVYHPDYRKMTRERAQARMRGEHVPSQYDVKLQRKDGSWFHGSINARAITFAGEQGVQVWVRDITERIEAEKALRESEERYRMVFENTGTATVIIEEDEVISMMNTEFEKLSGYTKKEVEGKMRWTEFVLTEDLEKMEGYHAKRRKNEDGAPSYYEFRFVDRQGNVRDIVNMVGMIPGTRKSVASLMDVTFRKEAEEAVRQSEQRYRFLVDNVIFGLFICEMPSGLFLFLNQRIREIFGYEGSEDLLNFTIWDVIDPDEHELLRRRIEQKIEGELPLADSIVYTGFKKDGSHFRVRLNASPVTYQGKTAMQGVVADVTETELLEKQLQQAHKMEAIGTLAGGIAHDFNNLLMAVQGNTSLMLLDLDSGHPYYQKLKSIEEYVRKGAGLTKQLLGFARGGKYKVMPTNMNELIRNSSEMFGRTKKEITIHSEHQEDLWTVEVDQGQIDQVLLNIYVNAWQAMPGGGDLFIKTENVTLGESSSRLLRLTPGRYVRTTIKDMGVGMDELTQQKIFDPFFTTKETGRGTGLGLASAYGIIKNHGGGIYVYSEINKGTTFLFYLPASEKETKEKEGTPEGIIPAKGTILLVDDEEMIIDVGTQMLERLGYDTLIARNGQEAMEVYKENRDSVDIVVLDMVMPGMGGRETYKRLKESNPDVKVLLSTGYSMDGQAAEILDLGCNGFIQKPFDMKKLSQSIQDILQKKPT